MKTDCFTRAVALADLKARTAELLDTFVSDAMKAIDRLDASGSNVAMHHHEAVGPYATPREVIAAYLDQAKFDIGWVGTDTRDRARNKRIKNYFILM